MKRYNHEKCLAKNEWRKNSASPTNEKSAPKEMKIILQKRK